MAKTVQKLTRDEYDTWANDACIEYAARSVSFRTGMTQRLVLGAFLTGRYTVTLGNTVLYDGRDIDRAIECFNEELVG